MKKNPDVLSLMTSSGSDGYVYTSLCVTAMTLKMSCITNTNRGCFHASFQNWGCLLRWETLLIVLVMMIIYTTAVLQWMKNRHLSRTFYSIGSSLRSLFYFILQQYRFSNIVFFFIIVIVGLNKMENENKGCVHLNHKHAQQLLFAQCIDLYMLAVSLEVFQGCTISEWCSPKTINIVLGGHRNDCTGRWSKWELLKKCYVT